MYGQWRSDFTLSADASPGQVRARACHSTQTGSCSDPVNITATTAPTIVNVQFGACLPANPRDVVTVSAAARNAYDFVLDEITNADQTTSYTVTINWRDAYGTLNDITHPVAAKCP
jgi:hypothetical protein